MMMDIKPKIMHKTIKKYVEKKPSPPHKIANYTEKPTIDTKNLAPLCQ